MMKTLQDIKDEVAREHIYFDFEEVVKERSVFVVEKMMYEVAKRYALEVAKETQRRCAENAIMKYHCGHFKTDTPTQYHQQGADNIQIDKQSILLETNIPELI